MPAPRCFVRIALVAALASVAVPQASACTGDDSCLCTESAAHVAAPTAEPQSFAFAFSQAVLDARQAGGRASLMGRFRRPVHSLRQDEVLAQLAAREAEIAAQTPVEVALTTNPDHQLNMTFSFSGKLHHCGINNRYCRHDCVFEDVASTQDRLYDDQMLKELADAERAIRVESTPETRRQPAPVANPKLADVVTPPDGQRQLLNVLEQAKPAQSANYCCGVARGDWSESLAAMDEVAVASWDDEAATGAAVKPVLAVQLEELPPIKLPGVHSDAGPAWQLRLRVMKQIATAKWGNSSYWRRTEPTPAPAEPTTPLLDLTFAYSRFCLSGAENDAAGNEALAQRPARPDRLYEDRLLAELAAAERAIADDLQCTDALQPFERGPRAPREVYQEQFYEKPWNFQRAPRQAGWSGMTLAGKSDAPAGLQPVLGVALRFRDDPPVTFAGVIGFSR